MSLLLASTAATTSARGDEEGAMAGPNAESERERAVRDFEAGRRAHMEGRLEEAELAYLRAWSRLKSFDIAANLGQVQLLLNKPASAAKHLAYGMRTVGPEVEAERVARMAALLESAKAQVGTVRVRVKNVADAEVLVDGERVPAEEAKHEIYVDPGEHNLVIRRAGYEDEVMRVVAAAGVTETVPVTMKPVEAKAPETTGPGAAGPGAAGPGAAGPRATSAPGTGGAKTKAPAVGTRVEERGWVPVIALGAASVVGLGVGVGMTVASKNASADAHAQRAAILRDKPGCLHATGAFAERCGDIGRLGSRTEDFGNGAILAYAASGTFALAALAIAVWPRSHTAAMGVRASTSLQAGGASISIEATW
ncbi:hypothetical protein WMF27_36545 [Sorangium sp. So ce281]